METLPTYYNTIDIDSGYKEAFERIYFKIQTCPMHGTVMFKDTKKGYHILFKCKIDCDLCRLVFDDSKRYALDFKKPRCKQNVLFEPFSGQKSQKSQGAKL